MDRFETASNASSSNLSSISGLTGFEDEFCDLKSVIREPSLILDLPHFQENLKFNDLQTALELNEKYRHDFYNLETKLESVNREKVQRLCDRIVQLEAQLAVTSGELTTRECNEMNRLRDEVHQLELSNNALKLSLEEHRIDLDTKSTSVTALKRKIVDLHVELQLYTRNNIKLNNDLRVLRNEFNSSKKSEVWYKERLHECRTDKARLVDEMSQLHSLLIGKERELNAQNSKSLYITATLEDLQVAYDRLSKVPDQLPDVQMYETTIGNLNLELATLKRAVGSQQESFDGIAKQNVELAALNADCSRSIFERDAIISNLENDNSDLRGKVEILEGELFNLRGLMRGVVEGKLRAECALKEAQCEKSEMERAVAEIRDNFSRFAERFRQIQGRLFKADQSTKTLEAARRDAENVNEKLSRDARTYCDTIARIQERLDGEIEKSAGLVRDLRLLTESKVECETKKAILESEVRKLNRKKSAEMANVKNRLVQIENRLDRLKSQATSDEEDISALKLSVCTNGSECGDDVRHLKALCKAKESEMKEKEKRFQANYRTLLRKVKEHMRGRHVAEKHCKYLQELHDSLAEELSTSKLQKATHAFDLHNLRSECENLTNSNVKLKREYSILKEEVAKYKNEALHLETSIKNQACDYKQLEERNQSLSQKLVDIHREFSELERKLHSEEQAKAHTFASLTLEQQRNGDLAASLNEKETASQRNKAENDMLKDELDGLKMKLTCNSNELTELREQKIFSDTKRKLEQIIIDNLKSDVRVLENDLDAVKSDKYFLQRLCNDLKFALTSSKNQSEALKKQLSVLPPEARPPVPEPSSACKYDEEFINELLKRSLTPRSERPLYELHNNLNLLKKEMLSLQKQVVGYNL
ncbi:myosin-11-like [Photinus pyralis]|nr:myosin-11-like [Photinus pyralis]XP_031356495.1 myosin-11-like [Photinus pyralis]